MVQITGTLTIKTITGRYGDFNVATLDCELGHFSVRDAMLDEYSEGTYQGTFGLKRIQAGSYQTRHRFVIETRAELSGIWLNDYKEEVVVSDEPMEEDPLAQERKAQQQLDAQREALASQASEQKAEQRNTTLATLFGELWPLPAKVGDIVKLNPEVGRDLMRQQVQHLKHCINGEKVWKFEPTAQHWIRLRLDEEAS